jgi:RNA polymerase sigma-70 factor (ECF subfamily)
MTKAEFESVVHEHQSMVYSIACHFLHNDTIAEEVAQEVFLQLYEVHRKIETGPHCVARLRRSTVHRCIDMARRASFRREVQVDQLPEISVEMPETDPLLAEILQRMLASLPAKPRAVLILRYGEDMDPEEIGKTLQMPVNTVWSHLQRGMAMIREKTTQYIREKNNESIRTRSS